MNLPKEAIVEFQKCWRAVTGEELAFADAEKQATTFLSMMKNTLQSTSPRDSPRNNGPP